MKRALRSFVIPSEADLHVFRCRSLASLGMTAALIAVTAACGSPARPRTTAQPEASAQSTPGKSLADLFRGKAGVTVTEIGDGVRLRIRGSGEIHAEGGDPLFVIDGAPINPPNGVLSMNPNDIVSIEILKDLAQTSIYGINGVNGVVRITTKRR